ncbi:proprotein convertase subtilisin/kexin type 6 isoform X2 [Apus apus]|uniref:proprotein convertase subtilisin/kexin type 6 isoform X2 n=1 Tax=Apus apus TaxID=8895 RepID=UPI0021F84146|nr:proprotein convertase subtilisin/kexin type 6 isoform X2 [Apus apus]
MPAVVGAGQGSGAVPPRPPARLCLLALALALSGRGATAEPSRTLYTNHWAVRVRGGPAEAARIAAAYGYISLGQIGSLENYYHFHHSKTFKRSTLSSRGPHNFLRMDPKVDWLQQQEVKRRVKRQARGEPHALPFNDPVWPNMWYLHCSNKSSRCRSEMNVLAAWQRGYSGRNVVVTILDDGIERNHPDLLQNYDPLASYDVNGNDHDPTPRYDASNENKHGTRCAGEVAAAANNSYCIVGIAYNARIGGIRMLDGDVTDVVEAKSLGIRPDYIDIYSASWGPDDDGKTVDGPGLLAKQAFEHGIKKGRRGLGSIFVWASGNGGREGDYCSCDGYTNSIYTISISSTTENGYKPWYLEECASTLATTYSSGAFYERKIVTTDLRHRCTDSHTGTSVSAPMVAGIIALALEANPLLTWRDVQHLLVRTSRPVHLRASDWKTNGAGHKAIYMALVWWMQMLLWWKPRSGSQSLPSTSAWEAWTGCPSTSVQTTCCAPAPSAAPAPSSATSTCCTWSTWWCGSASRTRAAETSRSASSLQQGPGRSSSAGECLTIPMRASRAGSS